MYEVVSIELIEPSQYNKKEEEEIINVEKDNNIKEKSNRKVSNEELSIEEDRSKEDVDNEEVKVMKQKHKPIEELDQISVQILQNLAKHLNNDESEMDELLKDTILKKVVSTEYGDKEFDIINAVSLFSTLRTANVLPYEEGEKDSDVHEDLVDYLLVDSRLTLSVKRLKKAIKFFVAKMQSEIERKEHEDVTIKELKKNYDFDEEIAVDDNLEVSSNKSQEYSINNASSAKGTLYK